MPFSCIFNKRNIDKTTRSGEPAESRTVVRYVNQIGPAGADGAPSFLAYITPQSHTISAGPMYATDGQPDRIINVLVFRGGVQIPAKIGTITGLPSGITITPQNNNTTQAHLLVHVTSTLSEDGSVNIPISYNADVTDTADPNFWDASVYSIETTTSVYSWTLAKSSTSLWVLDLSNENASINADASGNILSGAMRPSCKATLTHGSSDVSTGVYYSISYPSNYGVQGVSVNNSTGVMTFNAGTASTPFRFGDVNDPDDTVLEITVDASYNDGEHKQKVMTITKMLPGQSGLPGDPGEDAVSRWIDLSADAIRVDASNNAIPSTITAKAYKQIGGNNPTEDASATIKWKYDSSVTSDGSIYVSPITVDASKNYMTFGLYYGSTFLGETEEVPVLRDGKNGEPGGVGPRGAIIRGPVEWDPSVVRRYCSGAQNGSDSQYHPEDASYIDIVLKDSSLYQCIVSFTQNSGDAWKGSTYWQPADIECNFVATKLLLAKNAKIDFLTGNELYLTDASGNISGGGRAAGNGSDVIFWAGSDASTGNIANAQFQVDYNGNLKATSGTFAGYIQMKYVSVLSLPYVEDTADGMNYRTMSPGTKAYLISMPVFYQAVPNRRLKLPTPTAELNGFMYDIIIQGPINKYYRGSELTVVAEDDSTIACYAFPESRYATRWLFGCGRVTICCTPYTTLVQGGLQTLYRWCILSATGTMTRFYTQNNETKAEYISTVLGTSFTSSNSMIYNILTYTGTKPSADPDIYISNPNNIMYVQK